MRLLELKSKNGAVSYVPKDGTALQTHSDGVIIVMSAAAWWLVSGTTLRDLMNAIESDAPGLNVGSVFLILNNARSTAATFTYAVAQFKAGSEE